MTTETSESQAVVSDSARIDPPPLSTEQADRLISERVALHVLAGLRVTPGLGTYVALRMAWHAYWNEVRRSGIPAARPLFCLAGGWAISMTAAAFVVRDEKARARALGPDGYIQEVEKLAGEAALVWIAQAVVQLERAAAWLQSKARHDGA